MLPVEVISSTTGYLLMRLADLATTRMEQALRPVRLRGRTLRVLAYVHGGEWSQRDLCRQTGLDRTTMVSVVDELEGLAYVRRDRDRSDRRKQFISITDDGRTALSGALAAVRRAEDDFLARLDGDERRRLHGLLETLFVAHDPRCQTDEPGE